MLGKPTQGSCSASATVQAVVAAHLALLTECIHGVLVIQESIHMQCGLGVLLGLNNQLMMNIISSFVICKAIVHRNYKITLVTYTVSSLWTTYDSNPCFGLVSLAVSTC
jgi:hypothetical protein